MVLAGEQPPRTVSRLAPVVSFSTPAGPAVLGGRAHQPRTSVSGKVNVNSLATTRMSLGATTLNGKSPVSRGGALHTSMRVTFLK